VLLEKPRDQFAKEKFRMIGHVGAQGLLLRRGKFRSRPASVRQGMGRAGLGAAAEHTVEERTADVEQRRQLVFEEGMGIDCVQKLLSQVIRIRHEDNLRVDSHPTPHADQMQTALVEAESPEQALAMASKIPGASSGSVEVRPVMTFSK
jgi:hypothetical protein